MQKKEWKFLVAMMIVLGGYGTVMFGFKNVSDVSTIVTTGATLIAGVAFWLQLRRTKNLDEANFIMGLNDQFISNDDMTRIEHALELYYNDFSDYGEAKLELVLDRRHADCQRLINYLVYMEGLAALIQQDVMHLEVVDDLFAYRFFIAVNNPEVQKFEMIPFKEYYHGCFVLSKMWTEQWRKKNRKIPLDQFALSEREMVLNNK